jgi:hypothetical protein
MTIIIAVYFFPSGAPSLGKMQTTLYFGYNHGHNNV